MTTPPDILVIDNYDSFTFNLVHYVMELGAEVQVVRNDALSVAEALALKPAGVLPGQAQYLPSGFSCRNNCACLLCQMPGSVCLLLGLFGPAPGVWYCWPGV